MIIIIMGSHIKAHDPEQLLLICPVVLCKYIYKLKKRLILSVVFLLILMYITMGHNMLGLPIPEYFENNHIALAYVQMVLALIVMSINFKFFKNGFGSLRHLAPNMDTLVAMGSSVSFVWSIYVIFKMYGAADAELMDIYHNELYFGKDLKI